MGSICPISEQSRSGTRIDPDDRGVSDITLQLEETGCPRLGAKLEHRVPKACGRQPASHRRLGDRDCAHARALDETLAGGRAVDSLNRDQARSGLIGDAPGTDVELS